MTTVSALEAVRAAIRATRDRALWLPEGSTERAAVLDEVRELEAQAATLRLSLPVIETDCGACGGFGYGYDDLACRLCHGRGTLEREAA